MQKNLLDHPKVYLTTVCGDQLLLALTQVVWLECKLHHIRVFPLSGKGAP